ncbi:PTS IIA-like nitrogen-regulatory protein PtsN [Seongchinamella sediminis]|uniref:PTS IIA-like nitrogen-regulatory protein PtsN n=1 Tax=Seongchinamella sediminis TaxID=2283635 RepID=A0A3L7DWH2_9GAMM|nr:PTS IIA-like nitrogen regulatory protein PtsN [Seongchinamella sediminis]RLQ21917.1 PTS IIA-like nitrogen-regulatory protein PtsN [Seongchinamella sediminis]
MQPLAHLLTPERTACQVPGLSKKRLFETLARIISDDQISLPYDEVFDHLIARERLGSTGLGEGIAIPHCRIGNCSQPLGTLITLSEPIDFDAPDGRPVDLVFALLVPEEANQQHLDTLASLARLFSQASFCDDLRRVDDPVTMYELAVNATAIAS